MCSTFHCDLHVSRHFDESHNIDLSRNELQWFLFAAVGKTLGIHCIYNAVEGQCDLLAHQLCIICEMAFCSAHSYSHDCIGTHHSHENPLKYGEFDCQHCLIRFKEYSSSERYADFTHKLHYFEGFASKKNKKKMLKMKKKILPTCIPCERRVEKEFGIIPEYVLQSRLHDDGDDDKATDAHDQDHEGTDLAVIDRVEEATTADTGDDDAAAKVDGSHSQENMGAGDINYGEKVSADDVHRQCDNGSGDAYFSEKISADEVHTQDDEGAADASCDDDRGAAVKDDNIRSQNDWIAGNDNQNQNISTEDNKRYIYIIYIVWIMFILCAIYTSFRDFHHFLNSLTSPIDVAEIDTNLVFYDIMEGYNPFERFNCQFIAKGRAYTLKKKKIYLYWSNLKVGCVYCLEIMGIEDFERLKLERLDVNMYHLT